MAGSFLRPRDALAMLVGAGLTASFFIVAARPRDPAASATSTATILFLLLLGAWLVATDDDGPRKPTRDDATNTSKETVASATLPAEHPYYREIDHTTRCFRSEEEVYKSEARRRARYRSHDPRRWRARIFGNADGDDEGHGEEPAPPEPVAVDYPLFNWADAEREMAQLERIRGLTIQRPPLGYSDESARRLTVEAGCEWYFSIADFDEALLHGTIDIKHVHGTEPSMRLDLSKVTTPPPPEAKPELVKKGSPSSIMDPTLVGDD